MTDLLADFCWLRGRGRAHGRVGVVSDFRTALSTCAGGLCSCSSSTCRKDQLMFMKTREAILLIRRDIEMTAEHDYGPVLSNDWATSIVLKGKHTFEDGGLATSIVGRIRQALIDGWDALVDVTYVQKLITSAEENVRSSWARICRGIYKSLPNNKRLQSDITLSSGLHPVSSVAALGDGTHVVSVCGGMVRILNITALLTVLSLGDGK